MGEKVTVELRNPLVCKRRRLSAADDFFNEGNLAREEMVYLQSTVEASSSTAPLSAGFGIAETFDSFWCSKCGVNLPSGHLLDMHISETHDAFFQAQAARRLQAYQCLVEGCANKFSSIMDRRKHLLDAHAFPSNYAFDTMHLARKQAQARPERAFQKGSHTHAAGEAPTRGRGPKTARGPGKARVSHRTGGGSEAPARTAREASAVEAARDEVATKPETGAPRVAQPHRSESERPRESGAEAMDVDVLTRKFSTLRASGRGSENQPNVARGRGRRIII